VMRPEGAPRTRNHCALAALFRRRRSAAQAHR